MATHVLLLYGYNCLCEKFGYFLWHISFWTASHILLQNPVMVIVISSAMKDWTVHLEPSCGTPETGMLVPDYLCLSIAVLEGKILCQVHWCLVSRFAQAVLMDPLVLWMNRQLMLKMCYVKSSTAEGSVALTVLFQLGIQCTSQLFTFSRVSFSQWRL